MNLEEKTIEEDLKYEGSFIKVVKQVVKLPDGNTSTRDIVRHPGGVAVAALFDDDTILLVEQYRKPIDKVTLELPAGKRENGDDPKICGIRELEEETGLKAEKFEFLGKIAISPGFCDEYIYLYKAEGLYKGQINRDDDEFINVKKIKITEFKEMIRRGEITDAKTIAVLSYLEI